MLANDGGKRELDGVDEVDGVVDGGDGAMDGVDGGGREANEVTSDAVVRGD